MKIVRIFALFLALVGVRGFSDEQKDSCYIDMGILYGNYVVTQCIIWWPEPVHIDQYKVDTLLDGIFSALQNDGVNNVYLAFAQLCDIDALAAQKVGVATDTIASIFTDNYPVGTTGQNFLQYFINAAHGKGITVSLSFGGALAADTEMKLGGAPDQQASTLASFVTNYGFDSLDFDLEGTGASSLFTVNTQEDVVTFFETLAKSCSSTLTVAGAIQDGPEGTLKPLFDSFDTMFTGVNLMLYSNTQYYIDANNVTWGLEQWTSYVPASKTHVGFYDKIEYQDPAASAGQKYDIPSGDTSGQAAVYVYETALGEMGSGVSNFAAPFFWTDDPGTIPTNTFMSDFHTAIAQ